MKRMMIAGLVLGVIWTVAAAQQKSQSPEALLGAAIHQEEVEGKLDAAIASYKKFLTQHGNNRPLAAKAQYHLGLAYEKLGNAEARQAYERVVRDFADQAEIVALALRHLAALDDVRPSSTLTSRLLIAAGTGVEVDGDSTVAPDGRFMAMTDWSTGDLAIRDMSTGQIKRLKAKAGSWPESVEYGESPALSADLRQLAYAWFVPEDGFYQLRVMANEVGTKPRILIRNPEFQYFEPFAWSRDGKSISTILWKQDRTSQIAWVSAADGRITVLRSLEWRFNGRPHLSNDGKYIAFSTLDRSDSTNSSIYILAADGSSETVVAKNASVNEEPVWTPDGAHILFTSNRSGTFDLWAIAVRDGKPAGAPSLMKSNIGKTIAMAVTTAGSYYYVQSHGGEDVFIADLDAGSGQARGTAVRLTEVFLGSNRNPVWSPDGKFIAFHRQRRNARTSAVYDLVVHSLDTGQEKTFSTKAEIRSASLPLWFHDGKNVLQATQDQQGRLSFYRADLKTEEFTEVLKTDFILADTTPVALLPDDKTVYTSIRTGDSRRVVAFDLSTGEERGVFFFNAVGASSVSFALSPDGRTFAVKRLISSGQRSEGRLSLLGIEGSNIRDLYTVADSGPLVWTRDGRAILFSSWTQGEGWRLMRIPAKGGNPEFTGLAGKAIHNLDLSPDGLRIAFGDGERSIAELWTLDNILPILNTAR